MPPMRRVASGQQPGDREIAAFADVISRPLVIAGNGPSASLPPHRRIPADAVIFRMNWFFLESHYYFGSHVDAWFFAVPHRSLEETLAEEVRAKRYTVDRLLSPMHVPSRRDGDSWGNAMLDLQIKQYDHWAVISRHPRLARAFMSRPGLPTTGFQALGFALGVGFRDVYLSGIDLYESPDARYGYTITEEVATALSAKDMAPGYEPAHSIDTDLAFLRGCIAEFPDARLYNLSDSANLATYVPAPTRLNGPSMAELPPAQLGESKERVVVTLRPSGRAKPVVVHAAPDRRLWREIDGRRCAYVTVVAGNYHHGARALANSLRETTDVPLLALCTADANKIALAASGIHVVDIPEIANPNLPGTFQRRFGTTYTKLNVFRLDFLDRIVYLDSDTVVLKNIDDLFEGTGFAAAPDAGIERPSPDTFNSGVFAADPSFELFEELLRRLPYTPSKDGGDQGFLNNVFTDWRRLPPEYNTTKRLFSHHPELYVHDDIKVLHYVGSKPWEPSEPDGRYEELDRGWMDHLEGWELRELVQDLRAQAREALEANRALSAELPLLAPLSGTPFRQAQQLNAARRFGQAEVILREAWQMKDPTAAELREMAKSLRHQSRHQEAAGYLRGALKLAPGSRSIARELVFAQAYALAAKIRRPARSTAIHANLEDPG
jgi:lipopolysaccharide biosynthesis glycosyltransferase